MSETDSLSPPPSPSRPTPGAGDGDRDGGEQRRKQVKKADRLPPALLAPAGSLPLEDRFEWAAGQVMATAAMGTDAPPAPARRDPTVLALMDTYNHEDWMPDEETDKCLKCHREFTVTFRRVRKNENVSLSCFIFLIFLFSYFILLILIRFPFSHKIRVDLTHTRLPLPSCVGF